MLTPRDALLLLRKERLITSTALVDGSVRVIPAARRHTHCRVIAADGPAYFLKQGIKHAGFGSVSHEAAILTALHADTSAGITRHVPRLYRFDAARQVLITELVPDAVDLRSWRARRSRRSRRLARELGATLAALHQTPAATMTALSLPYSAVHTPPWALRLPWPKHRSLGEMSRMSIEFIKILQRYPRFAWHFERISEAWQPSTPVHYDIKSDNFLVSMDAASHHALQMKLVDWEFAGIGDPCWDTGAMLHDYLMLWIAPISAAVPIDDLAALDGVRYSMAELRPAVQQFWHTYATQMAMPKPAADAALLRSIEFAAVRSVQTAFEVTQNTSQMPALVPYLLQCALNILERPREAAVVIFGLTQEGSR